MVIAVDNHYQLRVQVPLTILPVPQPRTCYTTSLHHIDDNFIKPFGAFPHKNSKCES
jgi:hypothetical protein